MTCNAIALAYHPRVIRRSSPNVSERAVALAAVRASDDQARRAMNGLDAGEARLSEDPSQQTSISARGQRCKAELCRIEDGHQASFGLEQPPRPIEPAPWCRNVDRSMQINSLEAFRRESWVGTPSLRAAEHGHCRFPRKRTRLEVKRGYNQDP